MEYRRLEAIARGVTQGLLQQGTDQRVKLLMETMIGKIVDNGAIHTTCTSSTTSSTFSSEP
eukprot:7750356-Prorocentrum_lima.AAC.1